MLALARVAVALLAAAAVAHDLVQQERPAARILEGEWRAEEVVAKIEPPCSKD